jgi:hypothetical protein
LAPYDYICIIWAQVVRPDCKLVSDINNECPKFKWALPQGARKTSFKIGRVTPDKVVCSMQRWFHSLSVNVVARTSLARVAKIPDSTVKKHVLLPTQPYVSRLGSTLSIMTRHVEGL